MMSLVFIMFHPQITYVKKREGVFGFCYKNFTLFGQNHEFLTLNMYKFQGKS